MAARSQRPGENGTATAPGTAACGPVSSPGTRDLLAVNVRKPQ